MLPLVVDLPTILPEASKFFVVLPVVTDLPTVLPEALTWRVVLPDVVDLPSERPVVDVCRVVFPLRVDLATCLPELLYDLLELLLELELRLLLLLLLLVAANDVDTANTQATKAVSARTIIFFMMWTSSSMFNSGSGARDSCKTSSSCKWRWRRATLISTFSGERVCWHHLHWVAI